MCKLSGKPNYPLVISINLATTEYCPQQDSRLIPVSLETVKYYSQQDSKLIPAHRVLLVARQQTQTYSRMQHRLSTTHSQTVDSFQTLEIAEVYRQLDSRLRQIPACRNCWVSSIARHYVDSFQPVATAEYCSQLDTRLQGTTEYCLLLDSRLISACSN